jgi:hypothetical protein
MKRMRKMRKMNMMRRKKRKKQRRIGRYWSTKEKEQRQKQTKNDDDEDERRDDEDEIGEKDLLRVWLASSSSSSPFASPLCSSCISVYFFAFALF